MVNVSLSAEEAEIIREALSDYHDTLLLELSKADSLDFKKMLRGREAVVTKVLQQLRGTPTAR